jgi:hypothetical protein
MKISTLLLANLGKALKGGAQQELGDTRVDMPGRIQPTLELVDLFQFFNSVPQVLPDQYKKSFIHTDQRLFNVTGTTFLFQISPGFWDIEYAHWVVPEGAVNDTTSNVRLQATLVENVNPTVDVTRLNNTGLIYQFVTGRFRAMLANDQALSFFINSAVGAGTGTNRSLIRVSGNRLL